MTSAATAKIVQTEEVVLLPVGKLHKSPTQPRRRGDDKLDADFVASIVEQGVIQPIVVRVRKAGGWEIVYGHRRVEGSKVAKRSEVPAIIRELTDDQVFELQLIENVHREDMHPLDEADGFKRMLDHGRTAQQIAEKIGRPITYVAQRLKLCDLGKEARGVLDKDKMSLGVAIMVARIPLQLQAEAVRNLWQGIDMTQAKRMLEDKYLLRLDQAPFDITDAKLVEKAGACVACPKRTGQQRELFPDVKSPDLCIDRVCYRTKLDAVWVIRKKEAETTGQAVLEGAAADKALQHYGGAYKRLDAEEWDGGSHKKIRTLLGKEKPPVTLAREKESGAIVELVRAADVDKVLKRTRPKNDYNPQTGMTKSQEAKLRRKAAAVTLAIGEAVTRANKIPAGQLLRLVVQALIRRSWDEIQKSIISRRGIETKGKKRLSSSGAEHTLLSYFNGLTKPDEIAGLALELALRDIAPGKWKSANPEWAATMKKLGVKPDAIERKLAAEAAAKKKIKGKKAA